jgi:hypothetical protein
MARFTADMSQTPEKHGQRYEDAGYQPAARVFITHVLLMTCDDINGGGWN